MYWVKWVLRNIHIIRAKCIIYFLNRRIRIWDQRQIRDCICSSCQSNGFLRAWKLGWVLFTEYSKLDKKDSLCQRHYVCTVHRFIFRVKTISKSNNFETQVNALCGAEENWQVTGWTIVKGWTICMAKL